MKKNMYIRVFIIFVILLSMFTSHLYIENLKLKKDYGGLVGFVIGTNLLHLPRDYTLLVLKDGDKIDKEGLLVTVGYYRKSVGETIRICGMSGFWPVSNYLHRTQRNLNELYDMLEEEKDDKEIKSLVNEIVEDQYKAMDTYKKIEQLIEKENKRLKNKVFQIDGSKYFWYKNYRNPSEELMDIMENGLSE